MDTPHVIQTHTRHLSWLLDTHPVIQAPIRDDQPLGGPSSWAWVEPPLTLAELDDELAVEEERFRRYGGNEPRDPEPKKSSELIRQGTTKSRARSGSVNTTNRRFSTITRATTVRSALIDPEEIDWDGPEDPTNPQNWSVRRKWAITVILSVMTVNVYALFDLSKHATGRYSF
jgi:hypothetical protein